MLEGFVELTDIAGDTTTVTTVAAGTIPLQIGAGLDSAYISLGGLKMGYFDNAFDGDTVGEINNLGGSEGNTISYTFASGGFDATIGLDHASNETNFVPNVSANAGFSAGAVAVRVFGAYDEEVKEGVAKLIVGTNITETGRLEVAGVYASGETYSWDVSKWSVAAAYEQKLSDSLSVALNAQYFADDFGVTELFNGVVSPVGDDTMQLGLNVDWVPVTDFLVRAQVGYQNARIAGDAVATKLRFERSF
jgi:Porin subfamily